MCYERRRAEACGLALSTPVLTPPAGYGLGSAPRQTHHLPFGGAGGVLQRNRLVARLRQRRGRGHGKLRGERRHCRSKWFCTVVAWQIANRTAALLSPRLAAVAAAAAAAAASSASSEACVDGRD